MGKQAAPWRWHPLPAAHHREGKMEALLTAHGAPGPHALTVLMCEAATLLHDPRGTARMGWIGFAHWIGVADVAAAREVMAGLVKVGVAELREDDEYKFVAFLPKFEEWDRLALSDAERQRKAREAGR